MLLDTGDVNNQVDVLVSGKLGDRVIDFGAGRKLELLD